MSKKMCEFCGEDVIWYARSSMCKDCAINFFNKPETLNAIRRAAD